MRTKSDGMFWESRKRNSRNYLQYYNRLSELAVCMFEWKNLPPTIDERFLELTLFTDGMCLFFLDDVMGYLALRTTIGGNLNVYGIPTERKAYASNGYNNDLDETNSVIIYNNFLHSSNMADTEMFAERLSNLDRIIDVNSNAQKTPIVIKCDEDQRLTLKNLYMRYEGNEPFIFGDKNLDTKAIQVLTTNAPYVADKLYTLKTEYWNEALTYLGIDNINNTKKERMITDEAVRTSGGIIANRYGRLETRRKACREINAMFGLNLSVDFRDDFKRYAEEEMEEGGFIE